MIDEVSGGNTKLSDNPQTDTTEETETAVPAGVQVSPNPEENNVPLAQTESGNTDDGAYGAYEIEIQQPDEIKPVVEDSVEETPEQQDSNIPAEKPKALTNEEVTGHTANLWKYIPIPENEPEPAPEYINGTASFPGSKVIAARVRGKKHKHEGTNCDDWYEVANYENMTFVAVSDGAGSKKFSRIGARESCKAAIGYLVHSFKTVFEERPELRENLALQLSNQKCMESCGVLANIVQQSVIKAYEAVEAAFYSRSVDIEYFKVLNRNLQFKDLSATLLLAVMIPVSDTTKEHLVISCQIGDGMIALLNSKGEFANSMKLMGVPDSGDFSGETDFLTSSQMKNIEALQTRTKISRSVVDTMFVMTDGVADDYFPNETEMCRLYYDLVINGIIDKASSTPDKAALTPQQMSIFKKIPDPLVYPWVNDQEVKVAIQYTQRICEAAQVSLEDMWSDSTILDLAKLEMDQINENIESSERLKIWLDNYVERGSFDDRTLVIVQI